MKRALPRSCTVKPKRLVVLAEGLVECEMEKGEDDTLKLIDLSVKWMFNEPAIRPLRNDDPEFFEHILNLDRRLKPELFSSISRAIFSQEVWSFTSGAQHCGSRYIYRGYSNFRQ